MGVLSGIWSLINRLIKLILSLYKREEKKEEYTKEQFMEAVKELSNQPEWRAKILKDCLNYLKTSIQPEQRVFIDKDRIVNQIIHRNFGCGVFHSFGSGVNAIDFDTWKKLIDLLQQNHIKYVSEFTDCDNFATFFKGFADYILGTSVIYSTGLIFKTQQTTTGDRSFRNCICKYDYLFGGHGWNMIVTTEPIEYEKTGSTEKIKDNFTVYNYEPQNDEILDGVFSKSGRCYKVGGGLPVFVGGGV